MQAHKQPHAPLEWPQAKQQPQVHLDNDDFAFGSSVEACDAAVRTGFLRKVFGIVAAQLSLTCAVAAFMTFNASARDLALHSPSMQLIAMLSSFAFLFAAQINKDIHPTNLYCTFGFTLSLAWTVGTVCARFYEGGLGLVVLEAIGLTGSITAALALYTLRSKKDFSFLGAGLGASLWVLILGGLVASLTGLSGMHFALSVGGAVIFSLYIIYDVHLISKRLSPDEYIPAAIALYLDIVNLFLHILRILAASQSRN